MTKYSISKDIVDTNFIEDKSEGKFHIERTQDLTPVIEENKRKQRIEVQEQERLRLQKEKDNHQERLYLQNKRYYKRLGKPNMNKHKDDEDAWISLFRKKR